MAKNKKKTPADVALWYHRQGIHNDTTGSWLFTQGDDVHWCAGFALQCCRESGHWMELRLGQRGSLRSVATLQRHAARHGLFLEKFEDDRVLSLTLEGSHVSFAGVLVLFKRGEARYGHVEVATKFNEQSRKLHTVGGNLGDGVRRVSRSIHKATGFILVLRGGL